MKRTKTIRIVLTSVILLLVAGAAAIEKKWFDAGKGHTDKTDEYKTASVMDESGIGSPTSDDPWVEMEKLIKAYYGENQLITYHGHMRLIDDNDEKQKLMEELSFEYSSYKQGYYYRMGSLECVKKNDFIMMADHESRLVSIAPTTPGKDKNAGMLDMEGLKKILGEKSKEVMVTQAGGDKVLTVNDIQDPSIQGYQVFYDPVTYRVKKMLIGMIRLSPLDESDRVVLTETEKNTEGTDVEGYAYRLEILYNKIEKNTIGDQDFKPELKFIRFDKGKIELQPAFSDYRLLN